MNRKGIHHDVPSDHSTIIMDIRIKLLKKIQKLKERSNWIYF